MVLKLNTLLLELNHESIVVYSITYNYVDIFRFSSLVSLKVEKDLAPPASVKTEQDNSC